MSDTPWFVRRGSGLRSSMRPNAAMGWVLTLLYASAVTVVAILAEKRDGAWWPLWAGMIVAMTFAFVLIAWRTAAVVKCEPGSRGRRGSGIGF